MFDYGKIGGCVPEGSFITKDYASNVKVIAGVGLFSSTLSFFGSSSILGFAISKRSCCKREVQPLFHLSAADLLMSVLWISCNITFLSNYIHTENEKDIAKIASSCFFWQLLIEIVHLASFFLTANYSVHSYFQIKEAMRRTFTMQDFDTVACYGLQHWILRLSYVFSWILPIVLMSPVIVNYKTENVNACQKCVILLDVPRLQVNGKDSLAVTGYAVFVASLIFSALAITIFYILSLRLYRQFVQTGFVTDRERKKLRIRRFRITCYIVIFLICWTPAFIIASYKLHQMNINLQEVAKEKETVNRLIVLYCMQAAFAPLQGFLNSLAYGWSRKSFQWPAGRRTNQYENIDEFNRAASVEESTEVEGLFPSIASPLSY